MLAPEIEESPDTVGCVTFADGEGILILAVMSLVRVSPVD